MSKIVVQIPPEGTRHINITAEGGDTANRSMGDGMGEEDSSWHTKTQNRTQTQVQSTPLTFGLRNDSPLTLDIMSVHFPYKFKMLSVKIYDGTTDPRSHLANFRTVMHIQMIVDALLCRAFPITLTQQWFQMLRIGTIGNFA
ncbi:hypothetical protein JCGZ_05127 [Jatropha curcas]|uniref:Uncharacterized protein n=1 Tax=Jatropha curcas TaxID=180498 RepID=A0A067KRG7_JATCU|nr:hypothetical protein JCGZ_05127 [Jatropha curcas]